MSFLDNPVVSAIGSAIGLDPIIQQAQTLQAQQGGDPGLEIASANTPPRPGASKPNIPAYRERPYIPRSEAVPGAPKGGVTPGGGNPITPGVMDQSTLQDPAVQQMLAQYGVHPSSAPPDPNLFIHNSQAFNNHPMIAGMLERGLEGLAYAHPGENFFQSLIGGVRGMGEANAARASQANAQVMAPLEQAQAIANLQRQGDEHQTTQDNIEYHKGLLQHYYNSDLTRSQRLAAIPPRFGKNGQPYYYTEDANGKGSWEPDKSWQEDPQTAITRAYYDNAKAGLVKKYGSLEAVPPEELAHALQNFQTAFSLGKGAASIENTNTRAAASVHNANVRGTGTPGSGKLTQQQKAQVGVLNSEAKQIDESITKAEAPNSSGIIRDEQGKVTPVGSTAYNAWKQRQLNRRAAITKQRDSLIGLQSPNGTPATPQYSSNNPFAY